MRRTQPYPPITGFDDQVDFDALVGGESTPAVDDFDFDAMLEDMHLADTSACLSYLNSFRDSFVAAARREGRRNPESAWYHAVNRPMFRLRMALQFRIAALTLSVDDVAALSEAAATATRMAAQVRAGQTPQEEQVRCLRSQLEEGLALLGRTGDRAPRWRAAVSWCTGCGADAAALDGVVADLDGRLDYAAKAPEGALYRHRRDLDYITEMLLEFNHGLVLTYVHKFTANTVREDTEELIAAATVGLMRAISTYDPELGLFASWAFKPVQRDTLRAVRDVDFSNMTHGDFERRPVIMRAYEKLLALDPERRPTVEDVAAEAGVTVDLVSRVLAAPHVESWHTPVADDSSVECGDLLSDPRDVAVEDTVISNLEVDALRTFGLPVLEPKERYILVRRFGLHGEPPEALSDIGVDMGLSRESVRQNANKGLARLLHPLVLGMLVRCGT